MYGIIFELKKDCEKPFKDFDHDIKEMFEIFGFQQVQGDFYITKDKESGLVALYQIIYHLSKINCFKNIVQDIRAFKIEELSDFTDIVKNGF